MLQRHRSQDTHCRTINGRLSTTTIAVRAHGAVWTLHRIEPLDFYSDRIYIKNWRFRALRRQKAGHAR